MSKKHEILIVDDDESVCSAFERFFTGEGFSVKVAPTGQKGLEQARNSRPDLVILDIKLPGMSGLEALNKFKELYPELKIILVTAYGTLETAVEALDRGAFEYLTKPVDLDELSDVTDRALDSLDQDEEFRQLLEDSGLRGSGPGMVGRSSQMQEVFSNIARLANSDSTVLILGETGTGKELAAEAIHQNSSRSNQMFQPVDCASLSRNIIESELYGHEKGAFTGAEEQKIGKIETADGGTIFLDEVTELPPESQSKLLRFLEEQEFYRVGGNTPIQVDVRILAATNRDVEKMVREEKFREDLYYRLNVTSLKMPPLRDRPEDIPLLVFKFLKDLEEEHHKIPEESMELLQSCPWPGNVRQLRNAIHYAVSHSPGEELRPGDFPPDIKDHGVPDNYEDQIREIISEEVNRRGTLEEGGELYEQILTPVEKSIIKEILERTDYNLSRTSRILGITRTTLRNKARNFGILDRDEE